MLLLLLLLLLLLNRNRMGFACSILSQSCSKSLGVKQSCSLFAAFRVFLNIISFILFQCHVKVNYEIAVRKSIKYS